MNALNRSWKLIALGAFAVLVTTWVVEATKTASGQAGAPGNVDGGTASVCVAANHGIPRGPLLLRESCNNNELQIGKFDGANLTFTVPLGPLNISADLGVPPVLERSDQTTYQTPMFEVTTDPNGSADIIDGAIEEGSVYHHDVTLIARTLDGRAWVFGWGYLVAHRIGSPNIDLFSHLNESEGSIDPPPTSEVLAVGDHRILRVHGNGRDPLQWSAVVQRVKILPAEQSPSSNRP
jgi:hypothetical protein